MGGDGLVVVGVGRVQVGLQHVDALEQLVGLRLKLGGGDGEGLVGRKDGHADECQRGSQHEGARPLGERSAACAWCVFGLHMHLLFL